MDYKEIREELEKLSKNDYENYIKSVIGIEKDIVDENILNDIYQRFMQDDQITSLLSSDFDDIIDDVMISHEVDSDIELAKKFDVSVDTIKFVKNVYEAMPEKIMTTEEEYGKYAPDNHDYNILGEYVDRKHLLNNARKINEPRKNDHYREFLRVNKKVEMENLFSFEKDNPKFISLDAINDNLGKYINLDKKALLKNLDVADLIYDCQQNWEVEYTFENIKLLDLYEDIQSNTEIKDLKIDDNLEELTFKFNNLDFKVDKDRVDDFKFLLEKIENNLNDKYDNLFLEYEYECKQDLEIFLKDFKSDYPKIDGMSVDNLTKLNKNFVPYVSEKTKALDKKIENHQLWLDTKGESGERADFSNEKLSFINLSKLNLAQANFYNANLTGAILEDTNLNNANLSKADLSGTRLDGANLSHSDLSGADLSDTNLRYTALDGAYIKNTNLTNTFENDYLKKIGSIEKTLENHQFFLEGLGGERADFSNQDLSYLNLSNMNLSKAIFKNTDLSHSILNNTDLKSTDFSAANLTEANLSGADLRDSNLVRANLTKANLSDSLLRDSDLTNANLREAHLIDTDFYNANLTGVRVEKDRLEQASLTKAKLDNVKYIDKDSDGLTKENNEAINIYGNVVTDISTSERENSKNESFKVSNFTVVVTDKETGKKEYINCSAFGDKINGVTNFKKGDFVQLFGKENISVDKNGKEHKNLNILSSKLLKSVKRVNTQDKDKKSIIGQINEIKANEKKESHKSQEKDKDMTR